MKLALSIGALVLTASLTRLGSDEGKAAAEMARAASEFWAALDAPQQAKAGFEWAADERLNWHYIPKPRKGLPLKEMTEQQRNLAHDLLVSALSRVGIEKAEGIMALESDLGRIEKGKAQFSRNPEAYYFSLFGRPGPKETWGWRVEGHHLSLNFTVAGGTFVAVRPSFFGANPAHVPDGPKKGLALLAKEEELGRRLAKSLGEKCVIAGKAPADILTQASRKAKPEPPAGCPASQMEFEPKGLLMNLIEEYARAHRGEIADRDFQRVKATPLDKIFFAWAGGMEPGQGHYYRIQAPWFLIEYDNTQNGANHIHSVWRDLENDFGEDLLRRHLQERH